MKSPRNTALLVAFLVTALVFSVIQLLAHQLRLNDPASPIVNRIELLSHRDAELVFLGSSRLVSCIDEKTAEESLQLAPGKALSLAGNGFHPYDFLVIVREAEQSGALRAGMAIIEVEPSQFNINGRSPITGVAIPYPRSMKRWATWSERSVFPSAARLELVRNLFAPLALRRTLPAWMHYLGRTRRAAPASVPRPRYHHDAQARETLENDSRFQPKSISKLHFGSYRFSEYLWTKLQALVDLLERHGIKVVVFSPPARRLYWDYPQREASVGPGYGVYKKKMEALRKRVEVIEWHTGQEAGLDDSIFLDYGHCSLEGSRLLTSRLSAELTASLEESSSSPAGSD